MSEMFKDFIESHYVRRVRSKGLVGSCSCGWHSVPVRWEGSELKADFDERDLILKINEDKVLSAFIRLSKTPVYVCTKCYKIG